MLVFGPITTLTVAREGTVTTHEVLDGERTALTRGYELPADPVVYGFGGGDTAWPASFRAFADAIRHELKLRYGGALVADVNQVLTYGGIFAYPGLVDHPSGKLRLQFEGNPIAYIVEAAGGASFDDSRPGSGDTPRPDASLRRQRTAHRQSPQTDWRVTWPIVLGASTAVHLIRSCKKVGCAALIPSIVRSRFSMMSPSSWPLSARTSAISI